MRVHLIKKQTIENFLVVHSHGRRSFGKWLAVVKRADWGKPDDIQQYTVIGN